MKLMNEIKDALIFQFQNTAYITIRKNFHLIYCYLTLGFFSILFQVQMKENDKSGKKKGCLGK